jgi:probable HAF family extracellular repeat protein
MVDLGTLGGTYAGGGSCNFGASCTSPVPLYEGSLLINNRSQVVGTSNLAGDQSFHPFLWEKGKMRDLGTLGGDNGVAIWLTDNGEVIGQADVPGSQAYHGFRWKDGAITDLGTLEGDQCSRALMANSKGQIVGGTLAICQVETTRAFLWENGGPIVDLKSLTLGDSGANLYEADNINERGEIVASGLPAGCYDRFSCGHVYLLIPCDENHADIEGCVYRTVEESVATTPDYSFVEIRKIGGLGIELSMIHAIVGLPALNATLCRRTRSSPQCPRIVDSWSIPETRSR